jgi:deoxyribodipyrimidine photo-lyase
MTTIEQRIRVLNDKPVLTEKSCVLYIMARDQRLQDNFALQIAQEEALRLQVPLAVVFCLLPRAGYGRRAREHYEFMLAGLQELESSLAQKNIPFMMLIGKAQERLGGVLHHLKPQAVVFDFSPLRGPQKLHRQIAEIAACKVVEVDTHNIVPVWIASDHQEIAARTLRPKLKKLLPDFLAEAQPIKKHPYDWPGTVQDLQQLQPQINELLSAVPSNGTDISRFVPGEKAAHKALQVFLDARLDGYAERRNDPSRDGQSELNPYLHYGQLSSATVVRAVLEAAGEQPKLQADAEAFIEEINVRKELSDNFCLYNPDYDSLRGAPEWARRSLEKHQPDPREHNYASKQLEAAETHDEAWNAAQRQLTRTGKIHGYMRMYWAKKVLEWSDTPQSALETLLYFNDFYHIDGGDPNGYVGIMWSIAGVHDRPWGERPIYGTVRSMVYNGLKRKFDIQAYIDQYSKS